MNKQKGFAVIYALVGILVIIVVAGGGIYWTQKINKEPSTDRVVLHLKQLSDTEKIIDPTSSANPNQDETVNPDQIGANWKTYSNEKDKFSLKYPNNWNQINLTDKNSDYLPGVLLTPQFQKSLDGEKVENVPGIYIYILKIQGCTNSADYVQKEINTYINNRDLYPNLKIRKLNSNTIYGYIIDEGAPGAIAQKGPEAFIFQCPIEIQISFDPTGVENNQQLFDQILSTFKFTQ